MQVQDDKNHNDDSYFNHSILKSDPNKFNYSQAFRDKKITDIVPFKESAFHADYKLGGILGNGKTSTVRKITDRRTKLVKALKIVDKEKIKNDKMKHMIINEISMQKKLDYQNIVKIYDSYQDNLYVYIIEEMYMAGDLFNQIVTLGFFSEAKCSEIIKQLLESINYINSQDIIHRNINPECILLDIDPENGKFIVKLHSWSNSIEIDSEKLLDEKVGLPFYLSPDVVKGEYNKKCDIWSIGVIMYIQLVGSPPFDGRTSDEIYEKILKGNVDYNSEVWGQISSEGQNLVKKLLTPDPQFRISARDALTHEWFNIQLSDSKQCNYQKSSFFQQNFENLKKFQAEQQFKQATFSFISRQIIEKEQKQQLMEIFKSQDDNGDGVLSLEEITNGLEKVMDKAHAQAEAKKIFRISDVDNSGYQDYNEFVVACIDKKAILKEDKLQAAFEYFDKNGDGSISMKEIYEGLKSIGTSDFSNWENIMKEIDKNGDGEVDYEEFKVMMKKLT